MRITSELKNLVTVFLVTVIGLFSIVEARAGSAGAQASHEMLLGVGEVAMVSSTGPDTPVLDLDGDRDGTLRVQYTAVNAAGAHRSIRVQWQHGDRAPAGTSLRMRTLSVPAGAGQAAPEVTVSGNPSAIIERIPSCATGTGSSGALVEYRLVVDDPARAEERETTTVTLVFTISDDL